MTWPPNTASFLLLVLFAFYRASGFISVDKAQNERTSHEWEEPFQSVWILPAALLSLVPWSVKPGVCFVQKACAPDKVTLIKAEIKN